MKNRFFWYGFVAGIIVTNVVAMVLAYAFGG